jgi:hypothetical protein
VLKAAEIIDTRDANGVMASDHTLMVATFDVRELTRARTLRESAKRRSMGAWRHC